MFGVQELATAVQHHQSGQRGLQQPRFGNVLRDQKERYGGRAHRRGAANPDFVKLADSFGVRGLCATSPPQLERQLRESFDADAPVLIEVPLEPGAEISPWPLLMPAPHD